MFRRRLTVYGFLFMMLLLVLGFLLGRRAEESMVTQLTQETFHEARLVLDLVNSGTGLHQLEHLESFQHSSSEQRSYLLLDEQGNSLLGSHPFRTVSTLPAFQMAQQYGRGIHRRESGPDQTPSLFVVLQNSKSDSPIRYIWAKQSLVTAEELRYSIERAVFLFAVTGLLLQGLLIYFMTRPVLRSIQKLGDALRGEVPKPVSTHGDKELGRLVQTHNRMAIRIARRVQNLEAEQEQLRTILSGMVEGVIALDASERILFVNERAEKLLDLQNAEPVGRKLWDVVRQRVLLDAYQKALQENKPHQEEFNWYGNVNRSLRVHAAPLRGKPSGGAVLVLHDMTELRRLERMRQDFVANVSHELKTPLAVIQPCVETLLNGALEDPIPAKRFLEQISEQSERLHRLILDLLSLARIESGAELFTFEEINLSELLTSTVRRHQERATSRQQQLDLHIEEGAIIHADVEAIYEILDNLIDNALKYTSEEGRIAIRCRAEAERVIVEVEDSGIGIPEADLPRIFERFYRVDKARSRELGGTGLGLAIVKHLTSAMHGTIHVTSQPDQGTCFTIRFPRLHEANQC